jgi:hypothetical protein
MSEWIDAEIIAQKTCALTCLPSKEFRTGNLLIILGTFDGFPVFHHMTDSCVVHFVHHGSSCEGCNQLAA